MSKNLAQNLENPTSDLSKNLIPLGNPNLILLLFAEIRKLRKLDKGI
jgi:hypothetical protein